MRRHKIPGVAGVLTPQECLQTAESIAATQESDGALPWFDGGHTDPWDHIENAMALTVAGLIEPARGAFDWCRNTQRADGSWPIQIRRGVIEDANTDSNFCAYLATGVWHHVLVTDERQFAVRMWPVVFRAIELVLTMQFGDGEIAWAASPHGILEEALLTGCASIYHAVRCALALANYLGETQPEWEVALGRLGHVIASHPEAFNAKDTHAMEWYYPVLGGAIRGVAAQERIRARWDEFVVPGLGIRCVDHRPWVTGAETCELVMTLDAMGQSARAYEQFANMQHLREVDGSYWTGLVYTDGKRWPVERSTWTGAAMVLAADALSRTTPGNGIFRGEDLPRGLEDAFDCACATR
ncbi:MAG: prenyltransferase [Mycobacterium sp.]